VPVSRVTLLRAWFKTTPASFLWVFDDERVGLDKDQA
jgi:hypothetical protein